MSFVFEGDQIQAMNKKLSTAFNATVENLQLALESILREMANWVKDNHESLGGWKNQNGHLEKSISAKMLPYANDGKIIGALCAGQTYAIYVEFREGHWVLSKAFEEFDNKIFGMLKDYLEKIQS